MRGLEIGREANSQLIVGQNFTSQIEVCEADQLTGPMLGLGPQGLLRNSSGPVFNMNGINLEVMLTPGNTEDNVNSLMTMLDFARMGVASVDCGLIVPVSDEAENSGNNNTQSADIMDQRRLEFSGPFVIQAVGVGAYSREGGVFVTDILISGHEGITGICLIQKEMHLTLAAQALW
ncbi:hypothetical protein Dimus_026970 [Dionaea muscipula]